MAAVAAAGSLDYWRKFFRSTSSDIIDVIESAIMVATSDCPKELRSRRDQITEKLYSCPMPCCSDSDRDESLPLSGGEEVEEDEGRGSSKKESEAGSSNSSGGDELNGLVGDLSYNDVEALTEEIDEESQTFKEVLRIKEVIANQQDESDNVLFDSLRRLQLMALSVEALKATDIGRAVNGLRKHNSKQIRHLVRTLVEEWKNLVDEWVNATAALAMTENTPDSDIPADIDEEEGLPSPPLDEGALWATQTTGMQLSEFFDGMDDDGNLRTNDDFNRKQERVRHPERLEPESKPQFVEDRLQMRRQEPVVRQPKPVEVPNVYTKPKGTTDKGEMRRQEPALKQQHVPSIDKEDIWRHEPIVRQTKPRDALNGQAMHQFGGNRQSLHTTAGMEHGRASMLNPEKKSSGEMNGVQRKSLPSSQNVTIKPSRFTATDSGPGRPPNATNERRTSGQMNAVVQRKPPASPQDKSKKFDDASMRAKLDAAKRKLQENYQQAENSKRQRTVQVMEMHEVPKKAHVNRHPVQKPKSNIRNLLNRRR